MVSLSTSRVHFIIQENVPAGAWPAGLKLYRNEWVASLPAFLTAASEDPPATAPRSLLRSFKQELRILPAHTWIELLQPGCTTPSRARKWWWQGHRLRPGASLLLRPGNSQRHWTLPRTGEARRVTDGLWASQWAAHLKLSPLTQQTVQLTVPSFSIKPSPRQDHLWEGDKMQFKSLPAQAPLKLCIFRRTQFECHPDARILGKTQESILSSLSPCLHCSYFPGKITHTHSFLKLWEYPNLRNSS